MNPFITVVFLPDSHAPFASETYVREGNVMEERGLLLVFEFQKFRL